MRKIFLIIFLAFPFIVMAQSLTEFQNSYNFKRGVEMLDAETPDEGGALACFQKEIAEHPENGYAYYYMGLVYDEEEQTGKALECYSKAIELLKKDKVWLPFAYRMRAEINLKLGKDELSLEDWRTAIKEAPNDEKALSERAEYYYSKKEYDLADADYDRIIKIKPGITLGYNGKGRNFLAKEQYQQAIEQFNYSASLAPGESYAYANRAQAYRGLKKYSESSDDIIKALDIDLNRYTFSLAYMTEQPEKEILLAKLRIQQAKQKNKSVWPFLQALIYEKGEEYEKAIEAYKTSFGIDAHPSEVERISACYASLGNYQRALNYIDRAIGMDSTETSDILTRGYILYDAGLPKEAISAFTSYIEKEPDDYMGYYRRGFIKDCMGDIDGAIEDYTTSLVLQPDFNYALVERGECYKLKGNDAAAETDWEKDIEVDTVYDDCCAHYAYEGLGQYDKAKEVMDSILANSQDKGIYYDAACLYSRMGEYNKAMEFLRTSLEKGFRRFYHIAHDRDLDGIRNRTDFKEMIKEYESKTKEGDKEVIDITASKETTADEASASARISEIPFTRETGGLCKVKCNINGLPLNFWLDTGASDVSLSIVEATFMLKNGYLSKDDVVGSSYFLDANGNVNEGTVLNLKSVRFGDSELKNVKASVVSNLRAPLLLGQSVLSRLGSVELDNAKLLIKIKYYK